MRTTQDMLHILKTLKEFDGYLRDFPATDPPSGGVLNLPQYEWVREFCNKQWKENPLDIIDMKALARALALDVKSFSSDVPVTDLHPDLLRICQQVRDFFSLD
eukprot:TRINITY_DN1310_c0_g1_i2.p1 TRINITY_DN1310_c0_g1~~TRINITY_DN1310_c0_g1_i2.p1  ORF type:complete len:103 (-),score=15.26 TRINITY_DN1310_c0_g1_i2:108-416(-)